MSNLYDDLAARNRRATDQIEREINFWSGFTRWAVITVSIIGVLFFATLLVLLILKANSCG